MDDGPSLEPGAKPLLAMSQPRTIVKTSPHEPEKMDSDGLEAPSPPRKDTLPLQPPLSAKLVKQTPLGPAKEKKEKKKKEKKKKDVGNKPLAIEVGDIVERFHIVATGNAALINTELKRILLKALGEIKGVDVKEIETNWIKIVTPLLQFNAALQDAYLRALVELPMIKKQEPLKYPDPYHDLPCRNLGMPYETYLRQSGLDEDKIKELCTKKK